MADTFFHAADGDWFVPTELCRGPWDVDSCHGGPPTGLVARAVEQLVPDKRLTRLSVDLVRPVPMAGFRVTAEVVKAGRMLATTTASIVDGEDRVVARATAVHLAVRDLGPLPSVDNDSPPLAEATTGPFPLTRKRHDMVAFTDAVDVRYPPGEAPDPGPTTLWLRAPELLPGETTSPFQRICPLADCGNAVSRNAALEDFGFVNPDLTITLHRDPEGEWLGMRARSSWEPTGVGVADAELFDEQGSVGRAIQTLLITPVA